MTDDRGNPLTASAVGGRLLSSSQLPLFLLRPPPGYGVLTTTGRRSGKRRRRCIRAVRRDERVFVVAIKGAQTAWRRNALADPEVGLRIRGGRFRGTARELGSDEREEAREAYCDTQPSLFERLEYRMWRDDPPTPDRIAALHRHWFDTGAPLVIELG